MPQKGYPRRVIDFMGNVLTLPRQPKRIVSLTPGTTEVLFAIGAGKQVVGVTTYCDYPPEAKSLPKVGDVRTNIEAVVARKPDLVIADGVLNRRFIPALQRLRLPVLVVAPKSWSDVARMIRLLGESTGNERQAELLARQFEQAEQQARTRASASYAPKVLFTLNVEPLPLWVAGRELFIDDMIRLAGGRNVAAEGGVNYYTLSAEAVLRQNPEVIITTTPPDQLSPLYGHPVLKRVKAVQAGRVYSVDSNLFVRPTPRLLQGLALLKQLLAQAKGERKPE